ncbi:hypothetical protein ACOMHN_058533 [Nucella lapillus]
MNTVISEETPKNPRLNKKFWSYIKHMRSDSTGISALKAEGKLVTDPKAKAELLNAQFQSAFSFREIVSDEERRSRCPMPPQDPDRPQCNTMQISETGILKLLKSLNPHKACGPDGISLRVLRELAAEITPALTLLYRTSLQSGVVPKGWRTPHVTPAYKKGEKYRPENYRPISLTSIPCKILEHIIVSKITTYAEDNNLLCEEQHSFRRPLV